MNEGAEPEQLGRTVQRFDVALLNNELQAHQLKMQAQHDEAESRMVALGLPSLLERKRQELRGTDHEMPENAFLAQAVFDRILVWQIQPIGGYALGKGVGGHDIVLSDAGKDRLLEEAPRGIIVSAGLRALDVLRSNGMDIGHTVGFVVLAPYVKYLDARKSKHLVVLRDGDLIDSEDMADLLRSGARRVDYNRVTGQHVLGGGDGMLGCDFGPAKQPTNDEEL